MHMKMKIVARLVISGLMHSIVSFFFTYFIVCVAFNISLDCRTVSMVAQSHRRTPTITITKNAMAMLKFAGIGLYVTEEEKKLRLIKQKSCIELFSAIFAILPPSKVSLWCTLPFA